MSGTTWEATIAKMTDGMPIVPIVLFVVGGLSLALYRQMDKPPDWTKELLGSKDNDQKLQTTGPLKNIWDDLGDSDEQPLQKTDSNGKPFGSSYYYAHNSLRKTGGYTDGLRMEDYQMGTPRLLKRNGVNVGGDEAAAAGTTDTTNTGAGATISPNKVTTIHPITKYLWDDPGDKPMGTIRIDQLAENLSYKDANVTYVSTELSSEGGLLVLVQVKDDSTCYRLHIKSLYGKVKEVKHVLKSSRLLVRLYKQDASKAWPTPYKKGS